MSDEDDLATQEVEQAEVEATTDQNSDEAADELESATSESDSNSEADGEDTAAKPKKSKGVQKRIDELVQQRDGYKQQSEQLLKLLETQKETKPVQEPEPVEIPPAPRELDFDNDADYQKAMQDWGRSLVEMGQKTTQETMATQQAQAEHLSKLQSFHSKLDKLAETHPDAKALVNNPAFTQTDAMAEAILSSDKGAELAYELAINPTEALRISQLPERLQMLEMGKIEAKLGMPKIKTVSSAPPPVKPVSPNATGGHGEPETMEEYARQFIERVTR